MKVSFAACHSIGGQFHIIAANLRESDSVLLKLGERIEDAKAG